MFSAAKNTKKLAIKRLTNTRNEFLRTVKHKRLSIAQTIYIINKILYPKLLYIGQLSALTKNEWERLELPILKFTKHQLGVASSFPTSALHHNGIVGLQSLWQQFTIMNINNFIERINNNNIASITTIYRIKQGQLNLHLTTPIFHCPHNYYRWYAHEGKSNFNVYLILLAADMNISLRSDNLKTAEFSIIGHGKQILDLWHTSGCKIKLPKIHLHNQYPLFFATQLLANNQRFMITWPQYKKLAGLNQQGKKA